jgi:hypothetical protein
MFPGDFTFTISDLVTMEEEVGDGRSDEEDEYVMEEDEDDEDARIDDDHLETVNKHTKLMCFCLSDV